jgi:hypothetical protein
MAGVNLRYVAQHAFIAVAMLSFGACAGGGFDTMPSTALTSSDARSMLRTTGGNPWLPLQRGNTWTFDDGTRFVDVGPVEDISGSYVVEQINMYRPNTTAAFLSFKFSYADDLNANPLPQAFSLVEVANASGFDDFQDFRVPEGWLIVDFINVHPQQVFTCATFSFSQFGCFAYSGTAVTTIIGVHRTVSTLAGRLMDVDSEVDSGLPTDIVSSGKITWSFAKGVGFTSYSDGVLNLHLASFSLAQ